MNLGAEPKKVAVLIAIVVGGLAYYFMSGDSPSTTAPRVAPSAVAIATPVATSVAAARAPRSQARVAPGEFRPRILGSRADDKMDPSSIDPELKLDLLAKVQAVPPIEAGRNLFQFGAAPPPDRPIPAVPQNVPTIAINHPQPPPPVAVNPAPTTPPVPPAPPINLKYYGYKVSKSDGHKVAFLLDGEDILLGEENQTVKQRYRIVHIALTSIDIEDTQAKSTQTLKLQDTPS